MTPVDPSQLPAWRGAPDGWIAVQPLPATLALGAGLLLVAWIAFALSAGGRSSRTASRR